MEELRQTAISDAQTASKRPRFGLFNQPPPLYLGDDSNYKKKTHPRDQQGKPVTQPKNITIKGNKGTNPHQLFSFTANSYNTSQKYYDPDKAMRIFNSRFFTAKCKQQSKFKPSSNYKQLISSAYQHIDLNQPHLNPQRNRNSEGRVITQNRNMFPNPISVIQKKYFPDYPFKCQVYDRERVLNRIAFEEHKKKLREPFKQHTGQNRSFSNDRTTYGQENILPKSPRKFTHGFNVYKHDRTFRRSGPVKDIFGQYEFIGEKLQFPVRKNQTSKKQIFKPMSVQKSKPSPSISLNLRNINNTMRL